MAHSILVVDDKLEEVQSLTQFLQQVGFDVTLAHGGNAAIALLETIRPDAVICDLEMPDKNGYEVLEFMCTRLQMSDAVFLLANTSWPFETWSRVIGGRCADCHLNKPYHLIEVYTLLQRMLAIKFNPEALQHVF